MNLLKRSIFIGVILLPLSFVYASEAPQEIQDEPEITEVYQKGIDIRDLAKPDIRNIQEQILSLKVNVQGLDENVQDLNQAIADLNADVRENEIFVQLSADLLFDFDKSDIKAEAEPELSKLAKIITEKVKGVVIIEGHTDAKGSDSYNQKLSIRRAAEIHKWLVEKGQVKAEFKIEGYGETEPVAPNTTPEGIDDPEGRAKNRRVEVRIETKEKMD